MPSPAQVYWEKVQREEERRGRKAPPVPTRNPSRTEDMLARCYTGLRQEGIDLEELIGSFEPGEFTEKELKRLDKAVTVMKVGFKLIKMVLRGRGMRTRKKVAHAPAYSEQ